MDEKGIEPHIPVFDKSAHKDGIFERADFTFDHGEDHYACPGGKQLKRRNRNLAIPRNDADKDGFIRYRARKADCDDCALKGQCCPNAPSRKIMRSIHESARDMAQSIATTDA